MSSRPWPIGLVVQDTAPSRQESPVRIRHGLPKRGVENGYFMQYDRPNWVPNTARLGNLRFRLFPLRQLGLGQAVRQRSLEPLSKVRILETQQAGDGRHEQAVYRRP